MISFSDSSKTLQNPGKGEKDTGFNFTVGEKTGVAKIDVTASGGGESTSYNLEIDVRSPNPPETRAELKVIRKGEKWETNFRPFGMVGSNSTVIEVTSLPSINLEKQLDYLISYPHGCSEQIISAAFPQLFISDLTDDDAALIKDVSDNITEAINKVVSRQMTGGGIALWPNSFQADNWITSYAGHFLIEAERKGFRIPAGAKQKWIGYQKKISGEWHFDPRFKYSAIDQAYRLFTLALAGHPDKTAMNRLRESTGIPQLSRWLLAATYATTGRPEVAGDLLDLRIKSTEPEYQNYFYGSDIRDRAIILYTLILLKNDEQALPVLTDLCENFNKDLWYSTQSVAWGLFAYMKWIDMIPGDQNNPSKVSVNINGEKHEQTITSKKIWSKTVETKNANNSLSVENKSENPVYATLIR